MVCHQRNEVESCGRMPFRCAGKQFGEGTRGMSKASEELAGRTVAGRGTGEVASPITSVVSVGGDERMNQNVSRGGSDGKYRRHWLYRATMGPRAVLQGFSERRRHACGIRSGGGGSRFIYILHKAQLATTSPHRLSVNMAAQAADGVANMKCMSSHSRSGPPSATTSNFLQWMM